MALSKEQILSANDCPSTPVNVPEWGGDILIKTLSAIELASLDYLSGSVETMAAGIERSARFVIACAVDEAGNKLFDENDLQSLVQKHKDPLSKVFLEALKWNGLIDEGTAD